MQQGFSYLEKVEQKILIQFIYKYIYMSLEKYRSNIDNIDNEIIKLLEKRKFYSKCIGKIKKEKKIGILFKSRETEILQRLKTKSKKLEDWEIDLIYKSIFTSSRSNQMVV
jgi:chorismate mutase/prephenate dehydratase